MRHPRRLPVCDACLAVIPAPDAPACKRCGQALSPQLAPAFCRQCQLDPPEYDGAVCAASYRGPGRGLIHLLKFQGVRSAADFWAARLAARLPELPQAPELIVPVPLGKKRFRERGFNQSAAIARRLAAHTGCPCDTRALHRRRETAPQSSLPLPQRRRNLLGAFAADPRRIAGKSVLLVDDVLTTGATARAAAHALRAAGARRVMLAAAARADRHQPAGEAAA